MRETGAVFGTAAGILLAFIVGFMLTFGYIGVRSLGRFEHDTADSIAIVAILLIGEASLAWLAVKYWHLCWRFHVTDTTLLAVHRFTGERREIPWTAISGVAEDPSPWWNGQTSDPLARIELADGGYILIGPTMLRYYEFLEELKRRAVNCRPFDPKRPVG